MMKKNTHFNPPKKRKKQHHPKKGRNSKLPPKKKKKYHHPKKREEPPANSKKSGKKNPEFFGCQDHRGPTTTGATRRVEVTATEPSLPPSITEPRRTVPLGDETTKRRNDVGRSLPETNNSLPLKIGLNAPKGNNRIPIPSIFRCKLAVSFREGKLAGRFRAPFFWKKEIYVKPEKRRKNRRSKKFP